MTSTPVSLQDESLNGSWIDVRSASQIHSPIDQTISPEGFIMQPPASGGAQPSTYSMAESVQSLGLISFQVERFLQEAQRNQQNISGQQNEQSMMQEQPQQQRQSQSELNQSQPSQYQQQKIIQPDNISDMYLSDTDVSLDTPEGKAMISCLRRHQSKDQALSSSAMNLRGNTSESLSQIYQQQAATFYDQAANSIGSKVPATGGGADYLADQLSDSLSLLSRASALNEGANHMQTASFQDLDWLWDWTAQPEYFTGQEWKVHTPKQDYLMRQRQLYCANLGKNPNGTLFSGEIISLLFLTNILSIIIGAGLTYSIIMRRAPSP